MINEYTVDYFIKKFEAIPEDQWTTFDYKVTEWNSTGDAVIDKHCALGFCGERSPLDPNEESHALRSLFVTWLRFSVSKVNDGGVSVNKVKGDTPKERILYCLNKIKEITK